MRDIVKAVIKLIKAFLKRSYRGQKGQKSENVAKWPVASGLGPVTRPSLTQTAKRQHIDS